jgi:hypothetical protein
MNFGAAGELQDFGHIGSANASGWQNPYASGGLLLQLLQHGGSCQRRAAAATGEDGLEAQIDELREGCGQTDGDVDGAVEDEVCPGQQSAELPAGGRID